jgi:diacylglycerol kinase (ATP)
MARTRRIRILVNPSARSRLGLGALAPLRSRHCPGATVEWIDSESAQHFAQLVAAAQAEEPPLDALAVAGGDGTVTLLLNALRDKSRVPIAILPTGSGNDFARDIGVPKQVEAAFELLLQPELVPRPVDVAEAGAGGPRYCCVASVGLDEVALRIIHGARVRRSKALNIYAALLGLCRYTPRPVRVVWADGQFSGPVLFVAVTNTRSYGGGFRVSPQARIDDGQLDLCIVGAASRVVSKLRLLVQFPRILRGTHGKAREVRLARSPWVRIEPLDGKPLPLCLDGELPTACAPIELRCLPALLPVLGPPLPEIGKRS